MSLDPKTNREARESAKVAEEMPPDLEPPFPFPRVSFDPFFFVVDTVLTPREEGANE